VKGSTTYLPNAEGRAATSSTIAAASTAPCVSLSPASHIADTAGDEIDVIIVLPALPPMDVVPHTATMTKKKRKKATPVAALAAATDDASTVMPTPSTAPTMKKGAEPIDLRTSPMWVSTTDLAKHRVMEIAHQQIGVAGNAETIIGNVADEPTSGCQWY